VWSVSNLGDRDLTVVALDGDLQGRSDYDRPGIEVAHVMPPVAIGGSIVDVDVSEVMKYATAPVVTFRFQLSRRGEQDGHRTFVNIATMESGQAENRPQLRVTIPDGSPTTPAAPASDPTTAPPTTAAPTTTASTTTTPTTAPPATTTPTTTPAPTGWKLAWSDEFNGSGLDGNKWNYDYSTFGDGNKELACMTSRSANVELSNGTLKIKAQKESGGYACPNETRTSEFPDGRPYTSGAINSSGKFAVAFGRFEIRAKLPAGKGFWPAFWMTSQNYPYGGNGASGEIDAFEVFGQTPTDLLTSLHWYYPSSSQCPNGRWGCSMLNKHTTVSDTSAGFHTYAVEWDPDHIAWFFDGTKVFELGDGAPYQWASEAPKAGSFSPTYAAPFTAVNPMKLRINLAVGGVGPGAPDASTPFPGVYAIDYVRVYKR
jgi:beta-glucanase (GH16 family)